MNFSIDKKKEKIYQQKNFFSKFFKKIFGDFYFGKKSLSEILSQSVNFEPKFEFSTEFGWTQGTSRVRKITGKED